MPDAAPGTEGNNSGAILQQMQQFGHQSIQQLMLLPHASLKEAYMTRD